MIQLIYSITHRKRYYRTIKMKPSDSRANTCIKFYVENNDKFHKSKNL